MMKAFRGEAYFKKENFKEGSWEGEMEGEWEKGRKGSMDKSTRANESSPETNQSDENLEAC